MGGAHTGDGVAEAREARDYIGASGTHDVHVVREGKLSIEEEPQPPQVFGGGNSDEGVVDEGTEGGRRIVVLSPGKMH